LIFKVYSCAAWSDSSTEPRAFITTGGNHAPPPAAATADPPADTDNKDIEDLIPPVSIDSSSSSNVGASSHRSNCKAQQGQWLLASPHIFRTTHRSHITDTLITSACCSGVSSSFEILSLALSRLSTGSYLLSVSHNCTSYQRWHHHQHRPHRLLLDASVVLSAKGDFMRLR
jgi:hypothetical protein